MVLCSYAKRRTGDIQCPWVDHDGGLAGVQEEEWGLPWKPNNVQRWCWRFLTIGGAPIWSPTSTVCIEKIRNWSENKDYDCVSKQKSELAIVQLW